MNNAPVRELFYLSIHEDGENAWASKAAAIEEAARQFADGEVDDDDHLEILKLVAVVKRGPAPVDVVPVRPATPAELGSDEPNGAVPSSTILDSPE